MRQGLAIAIFIGIGLDLYKQNKLKKFVLLILLTATIHSSVLITLLIIPLGKAKIPYKLYGAIIALMLLLVITKQDITLINMLPGVLSSKILGYWGEMPISIMAFANKSVFLFLIFFFSYGVEDDENTKLFKKMYILGFVFYILTIKSMTISSRISLYFKIFEIALIPNIIVTLLKESKKFKALQLWSISMAIAIVLLLKTLNAFVSEGDYFKEVNLINYPYSNMFNKDRLWSYRERSIYHTLVEILYRTDKVKR